MDEDEDVGKDKDMGEDKDIGKDKDVGEDEDVDEGDLSTDNEEPSKKKAKVNTTGLTQNQD